MSFSLASSLGLTFSLSYYGATIIYGYLFKLWFFVVLSLAFIVGYFLLRRVVSLNDDLVEETKNQGNLLLGALQDKLSPQGFSSMLFLYLCIYMLLLVEELLVARLTINLLFPSHPALPAAIIATLCAVVIAYLKWGGFQAVLISDLEQLKLILPFVLAMIVVMLRADASFFSSLQVDLQGPPLGRYHLLVPFSLIFVVAWIVAPIDFYSRFNFNSGRRKKQQQSDAFLFLHLSMLLMFVSYLFGAIFGASLPEYFSHNMSPSTFTAHSIDFFLQHGTTLTSVVFFAGLFYMIFTTTDTLLITLLQIDHYTGSSQVFTRANVGRVLIIAVIISTMIPEDAASLVGIFVASLFILPLFIILCALIPRHPHWLATGNLWYVVAAGAMACILGIALTMNTALNFLDYFMFPAVVMLSLATLVLLHMVTIFFVPKGRNNA